MSATETILQSQLAYWDQVIENAQKAKAELLQQVAPARPTRNEQVAKELAKIENRIKKRK